MAKIIVVDDDADVRQVLSLQLRLLGHRVREASSGRKALDVFDESTPDLVLCDLNMPGGDGWWLLQNIRSRSNPPVPTIIVTGEQSPDLEREALELGAHALLKKPWLLAQLREAVRTALGQRSLDGSRVT